MKNRDVCKFIREELTLSLSPHAFVLETQHNVMEQEVVLSLHRVLLVAEGEGEVTVGHDCFHVAAGDLLFSFRGEKFRAAPGKDFSYLYINFDGARSEDLFSRFGIRPDHRHFTGYQNLLPLWRERLFRANRLTVDLAAEGVLLHTFSEMGGEEAAKKSISGQMMELMRERFTQSTLTIATLAKELSYNPKYLSHLFHREVGIPFTEYLQSLRLRYAITLFDGGLDSVKNVALLSGFSDPFYFSTVFKKQMKMTPSEYIAKRQTEE